MMELHEIVASLQDRRINVVSEKTGLHYNTIRAIRDGLNTNPSFATLKKLSDYLRQK